MSACLPCLKVCSVPVCTDEIIIGTIADVNTDVYIVVHNKTTNRKEYVATQSDGAGLVTLVTSGLGLMADHSYELAVIPRPGSPCDKYTITVGDFTGTCISVSFESAKDTDGCPVVFPKVTLEVIEDPVPATNCECLTQAMIDSWIESVVAGNAMYVDNTDPQNPIVHGLTPPLNDGLLSGGQVTWIQNYDYSVAAATYVIGGVVYTSPLTSITLSPSDPVLDRLDTFILDTSGVASALTGTLSATPIEPDVDITTQLRIAFAFIDNATTAPTLPTENIYLENTEWVTAVTGAGLNAASAVNPYAGAVDIEGTNVSNGQFIDFTPATFPSLITYDGLVYKIDPKAAWNNPSRLVWRFYNGTTPIGNVVNFGNGSFGFVSSNLVYQNINIPLTAFGNIAAATKLRMTKTGAGTIGFYLDNIQMVGNNNVVVVQTGGVVFDSWAGYVVQDGTPAAIPTATVFQTQIGTIVWTYIGVGQYKGTLTGAFTAGKTFVIATQNSATNGVTIYIGDSFFPNEIEIFNNDMGGAPIDGMNIYLEIRVYP